MRYPFDIEMETMIRHALITLFLITASATVCTRDSDAAERPNFLVILCDDLGYGDVGCFGSATIRTPHLDRLAAEGMRLTDCYSSAPVCSPSRAGMMTGRTPTRVGIYDWIPGNHPMHLRREEVTVATLLQRGGYATCHVGKWHLNGKFNSKAQPQPGDQGFDHWFSTQNNASPTHRDPRNFVRNGDGVGKISGYSCGIVVDEAIDWLEKRRKRDDKRPFFQFVCFHEPHEPVASPPDLVAQYPEAKKRGEALYYANVANMDRAVGKLMAAVDRLGLRDDTMVFFTSDNGPETLNRYGGAWRSHGSPGPLRGMKLHIRDGGIRVPGILRWPGKTKPGTVCGEPISGVDVLPTLCALAGVDAPKDRRIDGASFAAIFDGKKVQRATPLFWHYFKAFDLTKVAMRDGDWKIVGLWDGPAGRPGSSLQPGDMETIKTAKLVAFELYDMRQDIGETTDLAKKEPERTRAMSRRLVEVYTEVQRECPVWEVKPRPKRGK